MRCWNCLADGNIQDDLITRENKENIMLLSFNKEALYIKSMFIMTYIMTENK